MTQTEDDAQRTIRRLEAQNEQLTAMVKDLYRMLTNVQDQASRLAALLAAADETAGPRTPPSGCGAGAAAREGDGDSAPAAAPGPSGLPCPCAP